MYHTHTAEIGVAQAQRKRSVVEIHEPCLLRANFYDTMLSQVLVDSVGRDSLGTRQESQERPYALPPAPLLVERRDDGARRLGAGGSCSSHGSSV